MSFEYAIVLTGSIATGKSTTAALLSSLGFQIIDADQVAHQMLNTHSQAISERFGAELVSNGEVDRKALGSIVFADSVKRKALEDLLHPLIFDEIQRRSLVLDKKKKPYLVDIPLFFEGGRYPIEKSIVVYATKEQQLQRLMERNGYTQEEAQSRISTQMPVEEKRKKASYVIDNSGTLTQLEAECARVTKEISDDSN
ncbi:dephospho-CoA kinase [Sulfurovum sp.]|uniref:dephospho-CoA kinase n=1 Tax=Sulfurovum sp. TaxID=1969726 RepID=UPI002867CF31|nr:dephospho-CoA kinase [Sulfurovum sp.]